jgi:hypothetical protein
MYQLTALRFFFLYSSLLGLGCFFQFLDVTQAAGLLGRGISPSQCLYLNTGQHKQNKHIYTPNIHALSGIRTHYHSVRAREDSLCLRALGYRDRLASARAKTVHALDRSATVTGAVELCLSAVCIVCHYFIKLAFCTYPYFVSYCSLITTYAIQIFHFCSQS